MITPKSNLAFARMTLSTSPEPHPWAIGYRRNPLKPGRTTSLPRPPPHSLESPFAASSGPHRSKIQSATSLKNSSLHGPSLCSW